MTTTNLGLTLPILGSVGWGGTLNTDLTLIDAGVGTETVRAEGAESNGQTNLNTEATTRASADTTNATDISAETTRAEVAEVALNAAILAHPTAPSRQTTSVTTGSLVTLATANGSVPLAKTFGLISIGASVPCRVRLYQTAAQRTADAGRSSGILPTAGTQNGVIVDLQADNTSVQTGFPTTWDLSPMSFGGNCDAPPTTAIYYAIQNLSGSTQPITVTFTYIVQEI